MLVTSIFTFSRNVIQRLLFLRHDENNNKKKTGLCGKGLIENTRYKDYNNIPDRNSFGRSIWFLFLLRLQLIHLRVFSCPKTSEKMERPTVFCLVNSESNSFLVISCRFIEPALHRE